MRPTYKTNLVFKTDQLNLDKYAQTILISLKKRLKLEEVRLISFMHIIQEENITHFR